MKRKANKQKANTTKLKRKTSVQVVPDYKSMTFTELRNTLTRKQVLFCHFLIVDWNKTKAAKQAGYSALSADSIGARLAAKGRIKEYISRIKENIEEEVGISKIGMLQELKKIATSRIFDLYDGDWITRKEFDSLKEQHPEMLSAIQEVSTKIVRTMDAFKEPIEVEYVKIKLYNKLQAIDTIFKAMGWNEPEKLDIRSVHLNLGSGNVSAIREAFEIGRAHV